MANCSIYGKSLEYAFVSILQPSVRIDSNKLVESYKEKWDKLATSKQKDFLTCAYQVLDKFRIIDNPKVSEISIKLFADNAGKKCIVADLQIEFKRGKKKYRLKLSIKNNKIYAKSQRPGAIPTQCGYCIDDKECEIYKKEYRLITDYFYEKYKHHSKFNQLKKQDKYNDLYLPICNLVVKAISKCDKKHVQSLYTFLKGKTGYYQVVNQKKNIIIYNFKREYNAPTRVRISRNKNGYIILTFNNKHIFHLRLHTAQSKLTKIPSLKFDTVLINQDELYPKIIIPKDNTLVYLI